MSSRSPADQTPPLMPVATVGDRVQYRADQTGELGHVAVLADLVLGGKENAGVAAHGAQPLFAELGG